MRVQLCGGMFSGPEGGVCSSFRGKVYSEFIEALAGISLYQDSIQGEELKYILTSLRQFKETLTSVPPGYRLLTIIQEKLPCLSGDYADYGLDCVDDLITMFSLYSKIDGAELVSWY
jgi:hypothetical protein